MLVNTIEGAQYRLGKSQGYITLPVRHDFDAELGDTFTSSWQPTPTELAQLLAGAPIYLTIQGITHPPVMLTVGPVPEPVNDSQ